MNIDQREAAFTGMIIVFLGVLWSGFSWLSGGEFLEPMLFWMLGCVLAELTKIHLKRKGVW